MEFIKRPDPCVDRGSSRFEYLPDIVVSGGDTETDLKSLPWRDVIIVLLL
jgi:hypothetical protein